MSNKRFMRDFQLDIQIGPEVISFTKPLRIQFEATKSIYGNLNRLSASLYNLNEGNRRKLVKDREDSKLMPITLLAGYEGGIEKIFKGTIFEAHTTRQGPDLVTSMESIDGGHDLWQSFTSKTVIGKDNAVNAIMTDLSRITKGKITVQNKLVRPKVLVGNSIKLLQDQLNDDETLYIEDEKLYILKDDEVVGQLIPVVSTKTGLVNQPQRENKIVTFTTMLNPAIKIGHRADLKTELAPHLAGIYKIETIIYKGDNYGSDWVQECSGRLATGVTVL